MFTNFIRDSKRDQAYPDRRFKLDLYPFHSLSKVILPEISSVKAFKILFAGGLQSTENYVIVAVIV